MKKLFLTAAILAMSATAVGAGSTRSTVLNTAVTDSLTVTAKYVKPLTVSLDTTSIDFGDVYTDSTVATVPVVATVAGTVGETFEYTVSSNGSLVLLTGNTSGTATALGTGTTDLTFNVGLDTANLSADTDVSEVVTIAVTYDSIDDVTDFDPIRS